MSSGANGKIRKGGLEVGVLTAKEGLNDKMSFEQRPEWGGREPSGWCPRLNSNPYFVFVFVFLIKV